jgi:voltage-gated potassium channel
MFWTSLRRQFALALDPSLREEGLSTVNTAIISIIFLSLIVTIISTEQQIYQAHEQLFVYAE